MNNGRKKDVLIEEVFIDDPRTGLRTFFEFEIWADKGMKEVISAVEGVAYVFHYAWTPTKYKVQIDPRYDRNYVKSEIEAAIKCAE